MCRTVRPFDAIQVSGKRMEIKLLKGAERRRKSTDVLLLFKVSYRVWIKRPLATILHRN